MQVAEVKCGGTDAAGVDILEVYVKQEPYYSIYRTPERVMVHFADDKELAKQQSGNLAPLNPTRGQIYGLLDGWREDQRARAKARMGRYRRRIADALGMALENDVTGAKDLLMGIRTDIVEERTSWARFLYLMVASVVVVLITVAVALIGRFIPPQDPNAWGLWLSLTGGAIGAFFSIAIAIRSRTVLTDLHRIDNGADAVLRVIIGSIAAAVLLTVVQLHAFTLTIGDLSLGKPAQSTQQVQPPQKDQPPQPAPEAHPAQSAAQPDQSEAGQSTSLGWLSVLLLAFIAGFSERLVPDLLAKAGAGTTPAPVSTPAPTATAASVPAAQPGATSAAGPDPVQDHKAAEDQFQLRDCLCDHGVEPGEETPDSELPSATGGVAAPRLPVIAGQS